MLFCISHIINLLSEGSYTLIISRQTITGVEKPLIRPVLVLDLWAWTYFVVLIFIHRDFLTVPPDFQYQNGKRNYNKPELCFQEIFNPGPRSIKVCDELQLWKNHSDWIQVSVLNKVHMQRWSWLVIAILRLIANLCVTEPRGHIPKIVLNTKKGRSFRHLPV